LRTGLDPVQQTVVESGCAKANTAGDNKVRRDRGLPCAKGSCFHTESR
jgi:hypothetical protein